MRNNIACLTNIRATDGSVEMRDESIVWIKKIGTEIFTAMIDGAQRSDSVSEVAYVPKLTTKLLSVSFILRKGLEVIFKSGDCNSGLVQITFKKEESHNEGDGRKLLSTSDCPEAKC